LILKTERPSANAWAWAAWILPLAAVFWLYASSLGLPFYSDDVQILAYTDQATPWQLFSEASFNAQFYRPLANLIFKYAPPDPLLWHFAMLALHLFNMALVGALARRLGLKGEAAGLAMALFGLFPFNAQAVLWVAAFYHLAPAFLVLLAALALLKAQKGHPAWAWGAVLCASAAPFFIESGALAAPLLALLLLAQDGLASTLKRWRRYLPHLLLIGLVAGGYVLLRAAVLAQASDATQEATLAEKLAFNLPYLLQGLSLPTQGLWMGLPAEATTQAWLGTLSFGLLVTLLALSQRPTPADRRRYGLALLWIVALIIPNMVGLHPAYLAYSERTLYLASVGLAWGLGLLLHRLPPILSLPLLSLLLASYLGLARAYVQPMVLQGRAYNDLAEDLRALPDSRTSRLMLVNLPTHIEQSTPYAPLARAHAAVLADWIDLGDLLARLSGQRFASADHYYAPAIFPSLAGYRQGAYWSVDARAFEVGEVVGRFQAYDLVAIAGLTPGGYSVRLVGQQITPTPAPPLADWGSLRLLSIRSEARRDGLRLALTWHKQADLSPNIVPFVQGLCAGQLQAQADGEPLAGYYGFYLWDDGESWTDYRTLPAWQLQDDCTLAIGLYDRSTGQRLRDSQSGGDSLSWP